MIGFIAQSAPGLRSHFSDVWKNNLLFASPSIRRPTVEQMKERQGVTEELKMQDQMAWVGKMNNIRACAEEVVLQEYVYKDIGAF